MLLLFAATTGYQIRVFADAARRLGVDLMLATDRCHILEDPWGDHAVAVRFDRVAESLAVLRESGLNVEGVAAVGDRPAILAAAAAEMYGVPFHSHAAAVACSDKHLARSLYRAAGMRVPSFFRAKLDGDPREVAACAPYPCVLKPLGLSASRGVIRANDEAEFAAAFGRIAKMGEKELQVESYIPGREFAIEGLVTNGELETIAIFDKPDPLEGPYFEETIYVTPSREPAAVQEALIETTAQAVRAVGLSRGPVHAELRYNEEGAWILETHARPIGGLCARAVKLPGDVPLEEVILRHAMERGVRSQRAASRLFSTPGLSAHESVSRGISTRHAESVRHTASGVMMIPIPKGGIYHSVEGLDRARNVCGIEDVIITATEGQHLVPLPEGASYLGFIFARAATPEGAEKALRRSHAQLTFRIATTLETFRPSS